MKFYNFFEAPLPDYIDKNFKNADDLWDKFNNKIFPKIKDIYAKIINKDDKSAMRRFIRVMLNIYESGALGTGSSRAVFRNEEGRKDVFKIALGSIGLKQNKEEVKNLKKFKGEFLVKMIDHDEENDPPVWIQLEKARKINTSDWEDYFKVSITLFSAFTLRPHGKNIAFREALNQTERGKRFLNFLLDLEESEVHLPDLSNISNWGRVKDKIVIVDIGLNEKDYKENY